MDIVRVGIGSGYGYGTVYGSGSSGRAGAYGDADDFDDICDDLVCVPDAILATLALASFTKHAQ